jgi:capsular exopolysaccharide synthesis family protein
LLKQQMETTVNSDLAPPNLRVIQRPDVPAVPSSPRVFLDLLLGMLTGLVVAAGAVFAREYFDSSMKSSEEVEEFLHLPTLAAIPNVSTFGNGNGAAAQQGKRVGANGRAELFVLQEPWSQIAEAFRAMKTAVLFSANGTRTTPKVILVTSALAGEGKTFGSLNLAATLAEAGARVLLVDADLRHARCHSALGVENDKGLSTVLAGKAGATDVIKPTRTPRLFFVAAGPRPANPAELLPSGGIEGAIDNWRRTFNFVILDSPPALPVSDAVVLAQHVDGVVLVVKGDETPRELVRRARDRFVRSGAQMLGVVINNVGRTWGDPYFFDIYYDESNAGSAEDTPEAEKRA